MAVHSHTPSPSRPTHAAEQERTVAVWLVGAFLGLTLTINAFIAERVWPDAPEIGSISAFFGAILLGVPVVWGAVRDLIRGERHMNELVALAILASFARGEYQTAGVVAFFMLIADLVQHRTALGAREALESLVRLTPRRARLIRDDGTEEEVDSVLLQVGQRIRLRPGDYIPADGEVLEGTTSVDEATITGESIPADKSKGDRVFAGTVNLTGTVVVRVTRVGEDTTLGRVHDLILQAEETRIPVMRLIDEYVHWYTPVVLMIAGIIYFFTQDASRAITALVIACPCAFILATPTAMVAALSCAARLGILVKNVSDLEAAGKLTAIAFDKTGTLTTGRLAVTRLAPAKGVDPVEMLRLAASVERHSNHPAARAVMAVAADAELELQEPQQFEEVAGQGVRGVVNGRVVRVGRLTWLRSEGVDEASLNAPELREVEGISPLYVAEGSRCLGWIGVEDKARPDAQQATTELKELGIRRLTMFTGDRWTVARKVAGELGCTNVEAECLPERKLELVRRMKDEGHLVAVVGDGVNDAPALAAGDIGIAMGAAGSDIAIESASIALMSNDLTRLPFLIRLSRKTRAVVVQNLIFGAVFIVAGLTLASFRTPGGAQLLTPVTAAFLHLVSSFFVVFNSARLVRFGEELRPHAAPAGE